MYIGDKQIKNINAGLVTFEDGTQQRFTEKALTYLQSEEPLDPSSLQQNSAIEVAKDVMTTLLTHDPRIEDLNMIFAIVRGTIETEQDKFMCKATGLYSNVEKEIESLSEDDKKIQELTQIKQYNRQIRLSHYTNPLKTNQ